MRVTGGSRPALRQHAGRSSRRSSGAARQPWELPRRIGRLRAAKVRSGSRAGRRTCRWRDLLNRSPPPPLGGGGGRGGGLSGQLGRGEAVAAIFYFKRYSPDSMSLSESPVSPAASLPLRTGPRLPCTSPSVSARPGGFSCWKRLSQARSGWGEVLDRRGGAGHPGPVLRALCSFWRPRCPNPGSVALRPHLTMSLPFSVSSNLPAVVLKSNLGCSGPQTVAVVS
jgi:hypothetical protein